MHDTHMIEKMYESISKLCMENNVVRVNEINIEVDEKSHIDSKHMLSHLQDRDNKLFGSWTKVNVTLKPYEKLTAVIKSIDGDVFE